MKIFVLTSRFPYPLEKGDKLRMYHHIRALSQKYSVVLCALTGSEIETAHIEHLKQYCKEVYILKLPVSRLPFAILKSIVSNLPLTVAYFYSSKVANQIKSIIKKELPDLIYCQLVRCSEYVKDIQTPKILDYMDSFSLIWKRRTEHSSFITRWITHREASFIHAYERKIGMYFDAKLIISQHDKENVGTSDIDSITVLPNGIDNQYFTPPEVPKLPQYDVCFVGNLGYHPNIEACKFLIQSILPKLIAKHPNIKVLLAGARPSKQLLELANESVTVSGWLDDIREAYYNSKIMVAPLFQGAGQQNKIIESIACGTPCITTPLAANPYSVFEESPIQTANSEDSFAQQILELLENQSKRENLSQRGIDFVQNHFGWQIYDEQLRLEVDKQLVDW